MYLKANISGNYGGLSDIINPTSYIPKKLPTVDDSVAAKIASHVPAGKLPKNMPSGMAPYWTVNGFQVLSRKTKNSKPLIGIPAPKLSKDEVKIKVIRDLPVVEFPPVGLSGWEDYKIPGFLVLSLLLLYKLLK